VFWESRQNRDKRDRQCSFCGKRESLVKSLVESPSAYHCATCRTGSNLLICNECVQVCSSFLAQSSSAPAPVDVHGLPPGMQLPKPTEIKTIPEAPPQSIEGMIHEVASHDLWMLFDDATREDGPLANIHGHRAIGVVYQPEHDHQSNFVPTILPRRYDAFLFINESHALRPLN
jgi:hypothetical protein